MNPNTFLPHDRLGKQEEQTVCFPKVRMAWREEVKKWLILFISICICTASFAQKDTVIIATVATSPANPNMAVYVPSPAVSLTLTLTTRSDTSVNVKIYGSIERLSPSPFKISVDPAKVLQPVPLFLGQNTLGPIEKADAFGNFNINNLRVESGNIDLNALKDPFNPNNIILPDGNYRICFTITGAAVAPNSIPCGFFTIACQPSNGARITTSIVKPPVSSAIAQTVASGGISARLQFSGSVPSVCNTRIKIVGRVERLSPSPFTLTINPSYIPFETYSFGLPLQLTPSQQLDAFGNFIETRMAATGIALASLRDPANPSLLKLPDGNYRICFTAYYLNNFGTPGTPASDPNLGCASFTICNKAGSAPQFTQPVNNLNIGSSIPVLTPISPVVFTWTPPQSICGLPIGGYKYDFEIRELLGSQTVTDAVNNPFVFLKTDLPSTTFLLDTNLYRNVLQVGKRYAIRVKATSVSAIDSIEIENGGFSRVEAFQYGNNSNLVLSTPFPVLPPQDYYIPFGQRKTAAWNDVYNAYHNGTGRDTTVPLREYIALNLIQNGIAYNLDGIELFMNLNPELAGLKEVRLSNREKLPEFPAVSVSDERKFTERHTTNLTPDAKEGTRFTLYVDSLNKVNYQQGMQENNTRMISDLLAELNAYNRKVATVNRVSAHLLSDLLAELLYNLRQGANKINNEHLHSVVSTIRELMANEPGSTSYLLPLKKRRPLSIGSATLQIAAAGSVMLNEKGNEGNFLPAEEGELLPFQVVVWRGSTEPPARPISRAPGLSNIYQVFYATAPQYNHKNPEIGSVTLPDLASTSQVSLPKLSELVFWTMNMTSHQRTDAQRIETKDVIELNKKNHWSDKKKLYIVLKVQ